MIRALLDTPDTDDDPMTTSTPPLFSVTHDGPVATVTLQRPEVHNAFNDALIDGLSAAFDALEGAAGVRVVVLAGSGRSFCAGADLQWMRSMASYGEAENVRDARRMAGLFDRIDRFAKPVVGRIHGAAIGGGTGLVAACDISIAAARARFAFSEVRLGMAPAVISPFLIARIGASAARELFLTGARFDAHRALAIGLVNRVEPDEAALDAAVTETVQALLLGAPQAQAACKQLARAVGELTREDAFEHTASLIARLRAAPEGQEGMNAFLEGRKPAWHPGDGGGA